MPSFAEISAVVTVEFQELLLEHTSGFVRTWMGIVSCLQEQPLNLAAFKSFLVRI
jgi:hypothetical protein